MLHYQVFTVEDMSIFWRTRHVKIHQSTTERFNFCISFEQTIRRREGLCFPDHETSVYLRQNENINVLWYDILNTDITLIDCVYIQVLRVYLITR